MRTISHVVDIKEAPARVYEALTTDRGLAGWWSTRVRIAGDGSVGDLIDFTFGGGFDPDMEVTALETDRQVAWRCVGGHEPWHGSTFDFRLEERTPGCVLTFEQSYAADPGAEAYGRYNFNWGYYLESLRRLVEQGRGWPHGHETGESRKRVVERFVDEYKNRQNPGVVDELVAESCVVHIPLPGLPDGREGLRANGELMCGAFPDVHVEREFFVVEDDIVVERALAEATHLGALLDIPATKKPVTWTELHAYRVQDGLITEVWSEADFLGVMVQVGAVEPPGP